MESCEGGYSVREDHLLYRMMIVEDRWKRKRKKNKESDVYTYVLMDLKRPFTAQVYDIPL